MKSPTAYLILAPDAVIDLQLHTIYSDGTWTPEQLIGYLVEEQFGLAAITDHDRIDTIASLQRLAADKGLPLLTAVEMSASWRGQPTDILCYGLDPDKNALNDLVQDVIRRQRENTLQALEKLRQNGYTFPQQQPDELTILLEKPSSRQPFELVALLKQYGYGAGEKSVGQILREVGVDFATNEVAPIVDAAHRSGAVCIVAHPGRKDGFVCYDEELLDQLRQEAPIDGIEVYYPAHTPEQIDMYLAYARKHGLLISSGSDSHGPDKKPIKYQAHLSRSLLERLGVKIG